ncbi:MAG TPA: hypothetical protein VFN19_07355, partial [Candidatus Nanopelagicales bacterium]|nr:hypothetical protein [Candidatus Nanopelagicales bacterium]
ITCPPGSFNCDVAVGTPRDPGNPGGPGGPGDSSSGCSLAATGVEIPCQRPDYGWWSPQLQCYYRILDPQPSGDDLIGVGEVPDGSTVYEGRCANPGSPHEWDYVWTVFADPPPGTPVTPDELAQRATDSMTLLGADIHTSLGSNGTGLVGVPLWLWTTTGPTRWGPNSATASVPGLSVTATARAVSIVWDLGDGTTLTCRTPGTPYRAGLATASPDCGHVYQRSSARLPGNTYPVTATTSWRISWSGGGSSGTLTRTRSSTATVPVAELQVLIG